MIVVSLAVAGWSSAIWFGCVIQRRAAALRIAAHEIRGPLAALQLSGHASVRRGEIAPTALSALEVELRRIALALDDLVGRPARSAAPIDLGDLLTCQARTWADVAEANDVRLTLTMDADGALVLADATRLAQSIGNVVANAIEHGGGHVELRARRLATGVRVEVTDGGGGLPAPVADLTRRRSRGRRGHGLAIARQAIEREGGSLRSLPSGRGARLALELPVNALQADADVA